MDKLQLTGWNLDWVFNFRSGHLSAADLWCYWVKLPNLNLRTKPKQFLGYLPFDTIPGLLYACGAINIGSLCRQLRQSKQKWICRKYQVPQILTVNLPHLVLRICLCLTVVCFDDNVYLCLPYCRTYFNISKDKD
jgi:hypothetical protein